MDLSHFLRPRSDENTDRSKSNPARSILYKTTKVSHHLQKRDANQIKRKDSRRKNVDRLRGVDILKNEDNDEEDEPSSGFSFSKNSSVTKTRSRRRSVLNKEDEQQKILQRLAEYRLQKKKQKELEAKGKKPAFRVGAVHHKPYPFSDSNTNSSNKRNEKSILSIPTPKSASRKEQPVVVASPNESPLSSNKEQVPPNPERSFRGTPFKLPLPALSEEDEEGEDDNEEENNVPQDNDNNIFKTPLQPPSMPRTRRRSLVSPLLDGLRKDICFQRGTSSDQRRARKGLSPKLNSPLHDVVKDIEARDEILVGRAILQGNLDETEEKPLLKKRKDVSEFRDLYSKTVKRLTDSSDAWEGVEAPNEELRGRVSTVVGQARLIMSKKGRLEQFKTLVDNCEWSIGEKETNADDLRGFWDMIFYQIEGIYKEFDDLQNLKDRNWQEEEKKVLKDSQPKKKEPVAHAPKIKVARATSGLKAMLRAKRSQMKNQEKAASSEECKNFDGGFFQVSSPLRSSNNSTPNTTPQNKKKSTPSEARTPNSSSYLRKSILMNSVIRVSSSARRSLSTPGLDNNTNVKKLSPRRLLVGGAETEDLIIFETPEPATPRRSKRLSNRATPISYK